MRIAHGIVIALTVLAPPVHIFCEPFGLKIDERTGEEREDLARDRFVVHDRAAGVLRLARSYLISYAMGTSAKSEDRLAEGGAARITFELDSEPPGGAILYVFGDGGGELEVNGRALPAPSTRGHAGWAGREIAPGVLRAGANRFVFRKGALNIDTRSEGGHSERSFDGGASFRKGTLGSSGELPGEYIARLRVRAHPPAGRLLSPVLDLRASPLVEGRPTSVKLLPDVRTPEGTAIRFRFRVGRSPRTVPAAWTDWMDASPGSEARLDALSGQQGSPFRFLQWSAELQTRRPDRTPELAGVAWEVRGESPSGVDAGVAVVRYSPSRPTATLYPFTHETDSPRVRRLREEHRLDEVGRGRSELERQSDLRVWVGDAWLERWDGGKLNYIPPWDALEILELAPRGLSMGMCTHKGVTYAQAAAAVGYSARPLIVSGHCLAEVWSNQLRRWVLQDPGPGLTRDRQRTLTCRYEVDGAPASALDVHRAGPARVRAVPYPRDEGQRDAAGVWCGTYDRFGIPLRNDHLSHPEPAEEEHGFSHYRYDGYLWWSDDLDDPPYGEYSFLSNRAADFYPPLNATRIDLTVAGPGQLRVELSSEAPNLARFRVRIDGGSESAPGEGAFPWILHAGENRLEARAENAFGVRGPEEEAVIRLGA